MNRLFKTKRCTFVVITYLLYHQTMDTFGQFSHLKINITNSKLPRLLVPKEDERRSQERQSAEFVTIS